MIEWCKTNNVKYNARQLDIPWTNFKLNYKLEQVEYLYGKVPNVNIVEKTISFFKDGINLSSKGRECCGRTNLCTDKQYDTPQTFIPGNNFKGWSCGVNRFFVYIKQTTGEVFTNKDCLMNFEGKVGPIGHLKQADKIIEDLKSYVETGDFPVITCAKKTCFCGLCTPKAKTREQYDDIIKKYRKQDI
jgi:hypothetical protein